MNAKEDKQCSKSRCRSCMITFEAKPGEMNSTVYLGEVSMLYGAGGFLPQCPECGNWRDNQLVDSSGQLLKAMAF